MNQKPMIKYIIIHIKSQLLSNENYTEKEINKKQNKTTKKHSKPDGAVLRCKYNMIPFSVTERKRPGPDRRSTEISKLISEAITPAIFLEKYPRSSIDVSIEVLEAEGGTSNEVHLR